MKYLSSVPICALGPRWLYQYKYPDIVPASRREAQKI